MSWPRRIAALLALTAVLSGCASVPTSGERLPGELIAGRLSVRVEATQAAAARVMNAGFELEGDGRLGRLSLATPLGTMLAQIRWSPGSAVLVTPQQTTPYADLDTLTSELMGESVPVAALFDWLRGRPWPGAPTEAAGDASEPGFRQLGWRVSLGSFGEALVVARRERAPTVTVRAKLDTP